MDNPTHDPPATPDLPVWKLEGSETKFSKIVQRALETGPQRVTLRGQDAVVLMATAEYERLTLPSARAKHPTLLSLFADTPFARFDDFESTLLRERSPVRDAPEF